MCFLCPSLVASMEAFNIMEIWMTCSCVAAQCEAELCSSSISVLLYRDTVCHTRACKALRCRLELVLCLLSGADSVPTSLQGEKDWQKYETARRLKKCVDKIRNQYREDWKSKEMKVRQRAVALYFIDKVRLLPWLPSPSLSCWEYLGMLCVCLEGRIEPSY